MAKTETNMTMGTTAEQKVSVITCFLNVETYLQEAVESVLQQKYAHWELLLIDDGSTDGSTAIAKKYAAAHPGKVIYLEHEGHVNKGLSASRNTGIKAASGNLIAFLDGDDVWLPEYLENQVSIMSQLSVAMVCEATEYWYSWSTHKASDTVIPVGAEQDRMYLPPQLMLHLYPLGGGAAPCVCGIVVKKEALEEYGGFEEAFTGMYEDQVFLSKIYLHEPVYISSLCHNRYRQRPDSLVASSDNAAYHRVRRRFLEWLEAYLHSQKHHDAAVADSLRKALQPYRHPVLHYFVNASPQKLAKLPERALGKLLKQVRKYRHS